MKNLRHILLCILLLFFGAQCPVFAQSEEVGEDFMSAVLQEELANLFAQYSRNEIPATYMSFRVQEDLTCKMAAFCGSPTDPKKEQIRWLFVQVIVGGVPEAQNFEKSQSLYLPLYDDNEMLIRTTVRQGVEAAYREARQRFQQIAIRNNFNIPEEEDSYLPHTPEVFYEPPAIDEVFDPKPLNELLCQMSSYLSMETGGEGSASLKYEASRLWYVSTEGSYVVRNIEELHLWCEVKGMRPDGTDFKVNCDKVYDGLASLPQGNDWKALADSLVLAFEPAAQQTSSGIRHVLFPYDNHHDRVGDTPSDMFFRAVRSELEEAELELRDKGLPVPYRVEFYRTDGRRLRVCARAGSLLDWQDKPARTLSTRVWLGDDKLNNSGAQPDDFEFVQTQALSLPSDNHYENFRSLLRRSFESEYRKAWQEYEYKKMMLSQFAPEEQLRRPRDGYRESPRHYDSEEHYTPLDKDKLAALACELSAAIEQDSLCPSDMVSKVEIGTYQADICYFSSDYVQYKQPFSLICILIHAEIETLDGELFCDYVPIYVREWNDLPDLSRIIPMVQQMCERLLSLSKAKKPVQAYNGPVLVEGEAVAQVFTQAFTGPAGIYAYRPYLLQNSRKFNVGSMMENQLHQQVVHESCDVDALDTMTCYKGTRLIGSYKVDAEGIAVPPLTEIIHRGKLYNLLTDRTPTLAYKTSNGHRRLAYDGEGHLQPVVGAGVLRLTCHHTMNDRNLKKQLCQQARKAGYDYAYIIRNASLTPPEWWITRSNPLYVYRVDTRTGKEELVQMTFSREVRVLDFMGLTASSSEYNAYNTLVKGSQGLVDYPMAGVPCSVIVPKALLFERMELLPVR